jgi:hypothetical protein
MIIYDNGCFMLFFYLFGVAIDDDGLLMGMLNNAR